MTSFYPPPPQVNASLPQYATAALLPVSATNGDLVIVLDTNSLYLYDSAWIEICSGDNYPVSLQRAYDSPGTPLILQSAAKGGITFRQGSGQTGNLFTLENSSGITVASISVAGVLTLATTTGVLHSNGSGVISSSAIVNADVDAAAAIGLSKLATGALPSGITVSSANIVDGTIVNADVNASAAIDGTKISPNFGSQDIDTTGGVYPSLVDATLSVKAPDIYGSLDAYSAGGTLSIGTANANTINIGTGPGATAITVGTTADSLLLRNSTVTSTTGNVVTTGDTGTVTSTMILNGTIVDADINASAAIAITKIAQGTANQLIGANSGATANEYKTLAVGTSGTDFAVAHAANTITFNLPDASAANRGAITTGTQTIAGAKTLSGITTVSNATASTSTTTGALIVTGGVGIGGALTVASPIQYTGSGALTIANQAGVNTGQGVLIQGYRNGVQLAGYVGEKIEASLAVSFTITNNTVTNVVTRNLEAGTWMVTGMIHFNLDSGSWTELGGAVSGASASLEINSRPYILNPPGTFYGMVCGARLFQFSTSTPIYLVAFAKYTGVVKVYGDNTLGFGSNLLCVRIA